MAQNTPAIGDYLQDACQRSIMFLDVLRQRGNIYRDQKAKAVPHVLEFETELVLDGRSLPRPVNYALVRVLPPSGDGVDSRKRPFIVVDPRAGHGPGIGGMKEDSEIGVALRAGHPCYFVGFTPEPMPDQTIEDVWTAQAAFVAKVAELHPKAIGKPAIIANCQAGWQTMIMAAVNPDIAGPILLAGSPLSYWAGVRGKNPLRYLGGILGGTWSAALAGDIGGGKFDGANLVSNFEKLNPANTLWDKPYKVYANIESEVDRFLDFETWWGSPILLNAGEMQWIADNLFVGNKLARGKLRTSDGLQIDLRNISSPIIVFASWGDDITPPQQALGWITELYGSDDDIAASGQTIVYALHESIGHLGIFVSGKVAGKEHDEFVDAMDMIDMLPPGLYEAIFTSVDESTVNPELVEGRYLFRLEPRSVDDIRALGGNSPEDDLKFAAAARVSNINLQLYQTFMAPMVKAMVTPQFAEAMRQLHPNRMRFSMFSDENPAMRMVAGAAEDAKGKFKPVSPDHPMAHIEKAVSAWISTSLTEAGNERDRFVEQLFHLVYGSPLLHALVGLDARQVAEEGAIERESRRDELERSRQRELDGSFEKGGTTEAILRSVAFVRMAEKSVDERGFAMLQQLYNEQPPDRRLAPTELKLILRDQRALLQLDEKRALDSLAKLVPEGSGERTSALELVRRLVLASGPLSPAGTRHLARIEKIFGSHAKRAASARRTAEATDSPR